jgi:hypothetical protein
LKNPTDKNKKSNKNNGLISHQRHGKKQKIYMPHMRKKK